MKGIYPISPIFRVYLWIEGDAIIYFMLSRSKVCPVLIVQVLVQKKERRRTCFLKIGLFLTSLIIVDRCFLYLNVLFIIVNLIILCCRYSFNKLLLKPYSTSHETFFFYFHERNFGTTCFIRNFQGLMFYVVSFRNL